MKKTYLKPETELELMELEGHMLTGTTTLGAYDDEEVETPEAILVRMSAFE